MVEPRIVEPFPVGDQGAEDRANFQQLIPITIVACQAGGIKAEYQPSTSQTNFGEQMLEATAGKRVGTEFTQILINDFYSLYFAILI
jgi:hypothetical protein